MKPCTLYCVALAVLFCCSSVICVTTFHVKPNNSTDCTVNITCYTLGECISNKKLECFNNATKLVFLRGTHLLLDENNSDHVLIIESIFNFTLIGDDSISRNDADDTPLPSSVIDCNGTSSGLYINKSGNICISRLAFLNCGAKVTFSPDKFTVKAAVCFRDVNNVNIKQVLIDNSSGFGLHADRVDGKFNVSDSAFLHSRSKSHSGNARFWYNCTNCSECNDVSATLLIESSWFMYGTGPSSTKHSAKSGGLTIFINCPSINVTINKIIASDNRGGDGGNMAITVYEHKSSSVSINNSYIARGMGFRGGGIRWKSIFTRSSGNCSGQMPKVPHQISNTVFDCNTARSTGGGLYIRFHGSDEVSCVFHQFSITNCNFMNNSINITHKNYGGAAVQIIEKKTIDFELHTVGQFQFVFQNCTFVGNYLLNDTRPPLKSSIMDVISTKYMKVKDSCFVSNNGTAISLKSSNLILQGNMSFKDNTAMYGGALRFCDSSLMYINESTHVQFVGNHALVNGGAIFIPQERCQETAPVCFFRPLEVLARNSSEGFKTTKLTFANNTANNSGDVLYGGSIDYCYMLAMRNKIGNVSVFDKLFHLDGEFQKGPSNISSNPYQICICDDKSKTNPVNCNDTTHTLPDGVYPGQAFTLSVAAVGQRNGLVPSTRINAKIVKPSSNAMIIPKNFTRHLCSLERYIIYTNETDITHSIQLQVDESVQVENYEEFKPLRINILILPCPWGFELKENPRHKCDCDQVFKPYDISCHINNKTVLWPGASLWFGANQERNTTDNETKNVIFSIVCPFGYCKTQSEFISYSTLDLQCTEGRQGVLCGECKQNYSLALGTSRCITGCSYYHTLIFLPLIGVAGIVLILFLMVFNLTVSEGTINGLLFYANMVQVNQELFFEDSSTSNTNLFRIFVAWLSLDFGFEVCFYKGMDAYSKIWLEYSFLAYIGFLQLLIILLSRRYVFCTRLFRRNIVKVLATIILICYTKLLNTCISALRYAHLKRSDGSTRLVWMYDGNIPYFQEKQHTILFTASIIFSLILTVFTLSMLFIQCLLRRSNVCFLRWVQRMKPFFDAYTGPCKDNYRFWPGFLFFSRAAVFSVISVHTDNPNVKLYVTFAACIVILVFAWVSPNGVYKKWPVNIVEFSFFFNLCITSVLVATFRNVTQDIFSYTSVSIAMATFIGILLLNTYQQIRQTSLWRRLSNWIVEKRNKGRIRRRNLQQYPREISSTIVEAPNENEPLIPAVVRYDQYREPLLTND